MTRWNLHEIVGRSRDLGRAVPISHACLIVMKLCHEQERRSVVLSYEGNVEIDGPHMDVFALGVVLYELLTGEKPLVSAAEERAWRLGWLAMPPPSELSASVPRALEVIVQRALERNPSKRYAQVADLHAALERFVVASGSVCTRGALRSWLDELFPDCAPRRVERSNDATEKINLAC
jgi:serine/threonine protein kinase